MRLEETELLAGASAAAVAAVRERAASRALDGVGEVRDDELLIVTRGLVRVHVDDEERRIAPPDTAIPAGMVMSHGIAPSRTAYAIGSPAAAGLALTADAFDELAAEHPQLLANLATALARRVRQARLEASPGGAS